MRKERNKGLAIILSLAMVIGMMPGWTITVKAEVEPDYAFEEDTYEMDGEIKVFKINNESPTKAFNNISIPSDGLLEISVDGVTANSITIAAGGSLTILGDGQLEVDSIIAAPGAHMFLGNKNNKPSCVDSLYDITDGSMDITNDPEWGWFDFEYRSDDTFTGWGTALPGPSGEGEYSILVDGFDSSAVELSYCISTDGTSYGAYVPVDADGFETRFNAIPEDLAESVSVQKVKIKVAIKDGSNKKIYYAYRGAGWSDVHADELSADGQHYGVMSYEVEFDHTLDFEAPGFVWHEVHVALNNYRQGTQEAADLISNYLYAYGDLDSNGSVDETDMKIGLATELSSRFFWDEGGILTGEERFDIYNPTDLYNPSGDTERITITSDGSITAKDNSGADQSIPHYAYSINLGVTRDGNPVTASGDVYALSGNDQLLIWTGSKWFVRSKDDLTTFYEDTEDHSKDDKAVCVNTDFDPGTLKIAGNGCSEGAETISPEGDDVYCIQLMNYMYGERENPNDGSGRFIDYFEKYYTYSTLPSISCKLRLINADKTYVVVNSEGETKDVYGINSEQVDRIAQTGNSADKKSTDVFVGASAIHIEKVGSAISDLHITNVALKDDSMSDGVIITNPASDDFKVEFKSNFYDTVPLLITYDDGSVKELTINRVGLVISTQYLDDSGTYNFFHGGNRGSASCTYDYYHGQTIIVYATYYHPTNDPTGGSSDMKLYVTNADGTTRVINKAAYTSADSDSVAMTDFIIAFRCGSEKLGEDPDGTWIYGANIDPSMQAMSAIVLNSGYDNDTTFSGTQVGAGKGVYWDGHIEWNY